MRKYLKTYKYLIAQGMNAGKALLAMQAAFALSPEQVVELARRGN